MTSQLSRTVCNEVVRANLGTCFIYMGLAKSELKAGKRALAEQSLGLARSSHAAILRFLGRLEDEGQRSEVQTNLVQLGKNLDLLQGQLEPQRSEAILDRRVAGA